MKKIDLEGMGTIINPSEKNRPSPLDKKIKEDESEKFRDRERRKRKDLARRAADSVDIEKFPNLKDYIPEFFPNLEEEIKEGDREPRRGFIPSAGRMEDIPEDEDIHLTYDSVLERIKVLMHTHPAFHTHDSIIIRKYGTLHGEPSVSSEENIGRGISEEEVIKNFQEAGFCFVQKEGKPVMLVEAMIPAKDNTSGRFRIAELSSIEGRGQGGIRVEAYGERLLPADLKKVGFRQVSKESHFYISIPIEEIFKINKESRPIDEFHLHSEQSRDLGKLKNDMGPRLFLSLENYLSNLKSKTNITDKKSFYDFLSQKLGLEAGIADAGYLPYEPTFDFSKKKLKEGDTEDGDFLKKASEIEKDANWTQWIRVTLTELLNIYDPNWKTKDKK